MREPPSTQAMPFYGDLKRPCIRVALEANVALYPLIPLYDVLYTKGKRKLWFCDELVNLLLASCAVKAFARVVCLAQQSCASLSS